MARTKKETETIANEAPAMENTSPAPKAHPEKSWAQMTNAEREESLRQSDRNLVGQHAKAMKESGQVPFYKRDASKEQLEATTPFNPTTGQPYGSWLEAKMRMHQELNGFKEAKYVSVKQANFNQVTLKPLTDENGNVKINEKSGKPMYPIGVKMGYMQEYELQPKKDQQGNTIYTDKVDNRGEKIPVFEKVALKEPRLETVTFYNVEQLDTSRQKNPDKAIDLSKRQEFQRNLANEARDIRTDLSQFKLLPQTQKELETFIDATTKGKNFEAPQQYKMQEIQSSTNTKSKENEGKKNSGMTM